MQAPKIDPRSFDEIVAETEELVGQLTPWQPGTQLDPGGALIRIFGRYAEIVTERLNRVPEKSFLAFLNLIGADLDPALSARVPLTFQLATDSPVDAFIPAGTQAAAPPAEGEDEEAVFETERDLLATRAQLLQVYTRDFDQGRDQDRFGHHTAAATGMADAPFPLFAGNQPLNHLLYVACETLLNLEEPTDIALHFKSKAAALLQTLPITWSRWDDEAEVWTPFPTEAVSSSAKGDECVINIQACPPLKANEVNGVEGGWLRGQLNIPLPPRQRDIGLDGMAKGRGKPTVVTLPVTPFSSSNVGKYFFLCGEDAFARRGAMALLDVELAQVGAGSKLSLTCEYLATKTDGGVEWRPLLMEDGTKAFTQDGRIQIQIPAGESWQVSARQEWTSRWIRFTLAGTYSTMPAIKALIASTEWRLPTIDEALVALPGDRPPILATNGLANGTTLDLTKDFNPFGDQPQFNDTFYLAYGHVVSAIGVDDGDRVDIQIELSTAGIAGGHGADGGNVTLIWEYWNGRRWIRLGQSTNANPSVAPQTYSFNDSTNALTRNGIVAFNLPVDVAANMVSDVEDHWLRVRMVDGNYGHDAGYEAVMLTINGSEIPSYKPFEANYAPPIIQTLGFDVSAKLAFSLSACCTYNDFAYVDHTPTVTAAAGIETGNDSAQGFAPFTPTVDAEPAAYLGFDRPFDNRSVTLYAQVLPPTPEQVLPNEFQEKVYDDPPQLIWEYATADGWARLGVIDETKAFSDRGLIRFIGPRDFTRRPRFGHNLCWLRVRWVSGEFTISPHAERLRLNTIWARQSTTIANEILGSSNGEANQHFQTVQQPVQPEQQLDIRESELSAADIEQLRAEEVLSLTLDDNGEISEVWVCWQEVPDFYGSGPRDRHYILDHMTGAIQFGDGLHGLVPPVGINNVRMANYCIGGGPLGNRAKETIVQLKSTIPYVDGVTNFEPAMGGAPRETITHVKEFGPRTLRHRNRAVTRDDVEDLAYEASPNVARARAIPPSFRPLDLWLDLGNPKQNVTQHQDVEEAGRLGLIIVPQSDSPRPAPGPDLLEQVRASVLSLMGATADLWVSGPDWMEVTVSASIVPVSLTAADFVGEQITAALEAFLHPLTGGYAGRGWQFGRRPYRSDLYALIERIAGVDHVHELSIAESPSIAELTPGRFLIYSGHHQIDVII